MMIYDIDQPKFSLKFPLILFPFRSTEVFYKGRKNRKAYYVRLNTKH